MKKRAEEAYLFPFESVPKGSRIIIYGAGKKGQSYLRQLILTKYCKVVAMADREYASYQNFVVPVCPPDKIHSFSFDYVVIALSTMGFQREFMEILAKQGIMDNRIICLRDRPIVPVFCRGESHGVFSKAGGKRILFSSVGGLGDNIIHKRIVDAFVDLDPEIQVDILCKEGKSFLQFLYGDMPQVRSIELNLGVRYEEQREGYDAAIQISNAMFASVDVLHENHCFSENLAKILKDLKIKTEEERTAAISGYEMYCRCVYQHRNCYEKLSYGGTIPFHRTHVHIPIDPVGETEIFQMQLGKFITINLGNGTVSNTASAAKSWPKASFEKLITMIHKEMPSFKVVQIGSAGAERLSGADRYMLGKNFGLVSSLLRGAAFHIDIEGGLVHLASNLGTKCIVLFGPTQMPYYGYAENINLSAGMCHDCYGLYDDCTRCARDLAEPECMYSITPEMVMDAARGYLSDTLGRKKES